MASANLSSEALFGGHMETDHLHEQPTAQRPNPTGPIVVDVPDLQNANDSHHNNNNEGNASWVPRPKRVACVVCRKRKLRCDGMKPSCGSCARLGHDCAYNEVRKKSGPKRGYVKQLEARLAQVETLLKTQDGVSDSAPRQPSPQEDGDLVLPNVSLPDDDNGGGVVPEPMAQPDILPDVFGSHENSGFDNVGTLGSDSSWEMIGLGLEEPLPTQDVIDELTEIYFTKVHPSEPMIHRPRYHATMNLAPTMRPPVCLRYIMWANAAVTTSKYQSLHPHFYQRARKYAEMDEMKGMGQSILTVAHAQCWSLISVYEFKMMYFPRAWLSTGKASRFSLMLGLHRQDGVGLDVKQCLPPAHDWTEREERRRTFWAAFLGDRYSSVGTGWPISIDEKDILTNLPASDHAFVNSTPEQSPTLSDVVGGIGIESLSPYGSIVLLASMFGRNLHHLHRATSKDNDHDLNGEFWKRHRALDNIILNTSLSLPSHLRLPEGVNDPCVVFANMCMHASTISLHQAAIFKAEKNDMPAPIAAESKRRCIIAADQITNIMKMISHIDPSVTNPFLSFCLYVAARVFIQYLKSRPADHTVLSSLQFLLSALHILKRRNPLTESFIGQLDVDLEGSGIEVQPTGGSSAAARSACAPPPDPKCFVIFNPPQQFDDDSPDVAPVQHQSSGTDAAAAAAAPGYPTAFRSATSLPTREKFSPHHTEQRQQEVSVNSSTPRGQGFDSGMFVPFYVNANINDDQIRSLVMELDGSTEVSASSEPHHSGSDHPTPHTNKSSNSSVSPQNNLDQPSPPKQQQQQHSKHLTVNFPMDATASSSSSTTNNGHANSTTSPLPSFTTNHSFSYYTSATDVPLASDQKENPFALPAGWDYPIPQPRGRASGDNSMTQESDINIPPLDGVGWVPTPGSVDWNNWTNQ